MEPTRKSSRAGTVLRSGEQRLNALCNAAMPKGKGGRPKGSVDTVIRRKRNGSNLSVGSQKRLIRGGQRYTIADYRLGSVGNEGLQEHHLQGASKIVEDVSQEFAQVLSQYEKLDKEDKAKLKKLLCPAPRKRRSNPSSRFLEKGTSDKNAMRELKVRHDNIMATCGNDLPGQLIYSFKKDGELCKEALQGLKTVFTKEWLDVMGTSEMGKLEALVLKEETRLSDEGYRILRRLLPKGTLPSLKPVLETKFANTPGVIRVPGVLDGVMVEDPIGMMIRDIVAMHVL
jgi:hypothetical protein